MSSSTPVTCQIVRPGHTLRRQAGPQLCRGHSKADGRFGGPLHAPAHDPARRAGEGAHASLMRRDLMRYPATRIAGTANSLSITAL